MIGLEFDRLHVRTRRGRRRGSNKAETGNSCNISVTASDIWLHIWDVCRGLSLFLPSSQSQSGPISPLPSHMHVVYKRHQQRHHFPVLLLHAHSCCAIRTILSHERQFRGVVGVALSLTQLRAGTGKEESDDWDLMRSE